MNISSIRQMNREQFEVLDTISQLIGSATYTDNLIDRALDLVIEILKADRGLFARYDIQNRSFSIITARNIEKNSIQDLSQFSSGILQQVIEKGESCLYHDAQTDPQISQYDSVQLHRIKSVIGVPIKRKDEIWGIILVDSQTNRREFSDENMLFLKLFATLVSMTLDRIERTEQLETENLQLKQKLKGTSGLPAMIGESRVMKELAVLVHRVAQTSATVLLSGESGTGKELAARAIHQLSDRHDKPFIAQFCGSIPDTLLESELFGYKKGAFSGAYTDKKGLFEVADTGTFFLDEIGDISPSLQAKLLRVVQNKEIIRLGDTKVKKVEVRIIAATNRDLKKLVRDSSFREDLFYRLNVFPIVMPPLRQRINDIPLLADHFLKQHGSPSLRISEEALKKLRAYSWPGNVRQLENILHRAAILCDGKQIKPEHIILEDSDSGDVLNGKLKDIEKQILLKRLTEHHGNRTHVAESLGVSVRWVQLKLKELKEQTE